MFTELAAQQAQVALLIHSITVIRALIWLAEMTMVLVAAARPTVCVLT